MRVKFFPSSRISPFLVAGWGLGLYEQSTTQLDGRANPVPRELVHGAFGFGGGVDVRVWRLLALRGEARDFYTGTQTTMLRPLRVGSTMWWPSVPLYFAGTE